MRAGTGSDGSSCRAPRSGDSNKQEATAAHVRRISSITTASAQVDPDCVSDRRQTRRSNGDSSARRRPRGANAWHREPRRRSSSDNVAVFSAQVLRWPRHRVALPPRGGFRRWIANARSGGAASRPRSVAARSGGCSWATSRPRSVAGRSEELERSPRGSSELATRPIMVSVVIRRAMGRSPSRIRVATRGSEQ